MDTSPQTSTSISQLLGSAVRKQEHRAAVAEWLPPAERIKEVKGKRGWEKPDATKSNAPGRQGGWVVRNLTALLKSRDGKVKAFQQMIGMISHAYN
jgi:armadillo repeat-containing protein 8